MARIVWLASYPRSGNTLLRTILRQCYGLYSSSIYPHDMGGNRALEQMIGHLERRQDGSFRFPPRQPVLIKSHERPRDANPAIYVIRDGREVCVSFWHHASQSPGAVAPRGCTLRNIIEGRTRFGSWSEHVRVWSPDDRGMTLLIKYENMVENLYDAITKIGEFLGREPVHKALPTFEQMKQIRPSFFRAGTNRTWHDEMSEEDVDLFWELHGDTMRRYGYGQDSH